MSERAVQAIRAAIDDHGPISFAEFMDLALYGPGGFYEQPQIGEQGHFVTSPHVHPVFGDMLARGLRLMWESLSRPTPFAVLEVGAGDGTLAGQVLRALADVPKRYTAVERSPGARARLAELGLHAVPSLEVLDQHVRGCIVANELFDNLPFHLVRDEPGGLVELCVDYQGDRFVQVEPPCSSELLDELGGQPLAGPDGVGVVPVEAMRMLDRMARALESGYLLIVDYAWTGAITTPPHAYRHHHVQDDLLADPGSRDITVGVDFDAFRLRAEKLGLVAFGPVSQRAALNALGFGQWFEAERRRQVDALDRRKGREAVRAWSDRNAAALLVDPGGLGRLQWLVLATRGLPRPPWLREAATIDRKRQVHEKRED